MKLLHNLFWFREATGPAIECYYRETGSRLQGAGVPRVGAHDPGLRHPTRTRLYWITKESAFGKEMCTPGYRTGCESGDGGTQFTGSLQFDVVQEGAPLSQWGSALADARLWFRTARPAFEVSLRSANRMATDRVAAEANRVKSKTALPSESDDAPSLI